MALTNAERRRRLDGIIAACLKNESTTRLLHESLERVGIQAFTTVTKDAFPVRETAEGEVRKGAVLDVETTGLDPRKDRITELAMQFFTYDDHGILVLGESYVSFNDPGIAIPEEVTALTGITDDMVKGESIDVPAVKLMINDVDMIIAHNAAFDRRMVEANLPECGFDKKDWHCSTNQVDWLARGTGGRSMEILAARMKLAYGAHRAHDDCLATLFVLADRSGDESPFAEMRRNGEAPSMLVVAKGSPFETKDALKAAGYSWDPDGESTGGYKAWWKEIEATGEAKGREAGFLRDKVYGGDVTVPAFLVDPRSRYSGRLVVKEQFQTATLGLDQSLEAGTGTDALEM